MKKLAIGIMAVTLMGSSAMFAEDTTTAQSSATIQTADQAMAPAGMDMKKMKGKKGCDDIAKSYADQAKKFKDKSAKATVKGDAKLADLLNKCADASQKVSDQMVVVMKLKADCKANSSCSPMMDQGKRCGITTPKSCMKQAEKCEKMSQKMTKKADKALKAGDTATADSCKAASDIQTKMGEQLKSLSAYEDTFAKAKGDLKDYMKSLRQSKKDAKAQKNNS